ncbi:MAG: hypothetical protein LAP86_02255 [Acidobacteriia bacterium]|nr:hypothetical protein [Terriglobia bacterium]
MKKLLIQRSSWVDSDRQHERGVTMIMVALAMVAIIAMAALSIDVVTLYLAREEAQRSADSAALAAAKIISLSGLTGDPANSTSNWVRVCGPDNGTDGLATRVAKAVASQDAVGGLAATTVNVTYSAGNGETIGAGVTDCSGLASSAFGVNPLVTVQLTRTNLPSFFSRIWGNTGNQVSATATAEAFNPSNSGTVGNQTTGTIVPVQPRCVKPWVVANKNPLATFPCDESGQPGCDALVDTGTGQIQHPGVSLGGTTTSTGIIGETFWLTPDCRITNSSSCTVRNPPQANWVGIGFPYIEGPPNLLYVPGQVGTTPIAVPSSCGGDAYQDAIAGCDQPTNYSCGVPPASASFPNTVDLSINPVAATVAGVQCITHQTNTSDLASSSGQDSLNPFAAPAAYPFQMLAGSGNPTGLHGTPVSTSSSVVSLPIYDSTQSLNATGQTQVTFVGFLQIFINAVDQYGNMKVTVLNVAGCGNGSGGLPGQPQLGNSPVPVRLITPP